MKRVRRNELWEGRLFSVVEETWGERRRQIVEHPGSVAIVAVDAEGRLVLARQFREAARAELLELPAGVLEPGEVPLAAARRELAEETGLHGGEWRELRLIHPSPGFLREPVTLFLAEGLEEGEARTDAHEEVELVRLGPGELPSLLDELEDAKTLVGVLLYLRERR
jgi:ADP-ribose pyrophosphatase